jgi:hypothetical protein
MASSRDADTWRPVSEPTNAHPVYRPSDDGTILIYRGDLLLSQGSVERTATGDLELRLSPRPALSAHVAGTDDLLASAVEGENLMVAVPAEASLRPPTSVLPVERDDAFAWADFPISINELVAGDARLAERLILHISGPLTTRLPLSHAESAPQEQVQVRLGSWDLRLAATGALRAMEDFSFVVEAVPHERPVNEEAARRVRRQIFLLFSLIAG